MNAIVRNVRDIDQSDRSAIERVVGQYLGDNQRLIIQVTEINGSRDDASAETRPAQSIDDWTRVYEGLSDEEINVIDAAVKTRANLTRNLP